VNLVVVVLGSRNVTVPVKSVADAAAADPEPAAADGAADELSPAVCGLVVQAAVSRTTPNAANPAKLILFIE
jgi:hypothetical protein